MDQAKHNGLHGLEGAQSAFPLSMIGKVDLTGRQFLQVDPGAKGATGSGNGYDPNILISADLIGHRLQVASSLGIHGIEHLRAMQRDPSDGPILFPKHSLKFRHGRGSSSQELFSEK